MKNTKTEIKFFSIPEWNKEEQYLREQHKNGWEFVEVNGFCQYHFRKCEPKDMVYQLDYNPDSVSQKEEYIQMFNDCGWEYLQNYVGYSYFRKASSEMDGTEEEIFCDDNSRLDMMTRVFKGRMLPLLAVFFCIIIPQIIMQSQIQSTVNKGLMVFFCVLFVIYLILFMAFAIPFWKYYKSVHKE
ncbi:MAG: DUF2812 domain-containing protein [Lachnospiraceae bacterium]|nr:DUF2812 domain-containing protein [Lachnospiraceae bacterium]